MSVLDRRDPAAVASAMRLLRLVTSVYHRAAVSGMENVPEGGALIVGNHSGGMTPMDVPVLAVAFTREFGPERPLYCLAHDSLFIGSLKPIMPRYGFVPATRANAHEVLTSGAVTIVFPGGDWDAFRPFTRLNRIDFHGRKGYVRTALEAGVPIVPVVSIGGQETQLFLSRGQFLGRHSPLRRVLRTDLLPISFGFPFGLTLSPLNLPLPSKITTRVLEPLDVTAEFGDDPDIDAVDAEVRRRMQEALDELARERRLPVLG